MTAPRKVVIGSAELWLGDCRDVLPMLDKFDAVITDPPYAVSVAGSFSVGPHGTRRLDFFAGDDDWPAMNALVMEAIIKSVNYNPLSFVVWCSHRQIGYINDILEKAGYSTRQLFWRKKCPTPVAPRSGFSSAVEQAIYGYKMGRFFGAGQYEPNIFDCDNYRYGQLGKVDHPTQKPQSLIDWNVICTTAPGSLVCDFFMGSGTTGVSCARLGRRFVGCEIHEPYFNIACRRIEDAQKQSDLFIPQLHAPIAKTGKLFK